ncbi:MAG: hypothetical protein JW984_13885 [Deltaproteobacteria bacterium]|uniref:Uncharacterized protein n=1 Tax=Candidatus Zymogenus saltonus TaxID=2844893 RepID=A0A9D8KGJ5_9DELT|nr:hypothetical protein [Candidatus Zymogenus saltonus]
MKRTTIFIFMALFLMFHSSGFPAENRVCDFIKKSLNQFGDTKNSVIGKMGKPSELKIEELESMWYPGEKDRVYSLKYPGLLIETLYLFQKENSTEYPLTVEVTSDMYVLHNGLKVGSSKANVLSALGDPGEKAEEEKYWLYSCEVENVYFYFEGDKVTKISCQGYFP